MNVTNQNNNTEFLQQGSLERLTPYFRSAAYSLAIGVLSSQITHFAHLSKQAIKSALLPWEVNPSWINMREAAVCEKNICVAFRDCLLTEAVAQKEAIKKFSNKNRIKAKTKALNKKVASLLQNIDTKIKLAEANIACINEIESLYQYGNSVSILRFGLDFIIPKGGTLVHALASAEIALTRFQLAQNLPTESSCRTKILNDLDLDTCLRTNGEIGCLCKETLLAVPLQLLRETVKAHLFG